MYKVKWNGPSGVEKEIAVPTLDSAMSFSKSLGRFVSIQGGGMEIVGKFGVDSIKDGKCPDGVEYSWVKRRKSEYT